MKIAVAGAGAMGSLFAWQLAEAGAQVWIYDVWQAHIDAVRTSGLRVQTDEGERTIGLNATTDPEEIGPCDVVQIFVKYHQTEAAAKAVLPTVDKNTLIVTIQNGLGNVNLLRRVFPNNRIAYGLTTLTSELKAPGLIEASFRGHGETYLWPDDAVPSQPELALCSLLDKGRWRAAIDPQIDLRIWKKLIINCCFNTVCTILDCSVGEAMSNPHAQDLFALIIEELCCAAGANGTSITPTAALSYLEQVGREAAKHIPSMVIDMRAGRKTEIECLNMAICRIGDEAGFSTKVNRSLSTLILAAESYPRNLL